MPTVLRAGAYRLYFYAADRGEPPHVHVAHGSNDAKVWINPVSLARVGGFRPHEVARILDLVGEHQLQLLEAWNGFFKR